MIDLNTLRHTKHIGLGCSTFGGSNSRVVANRALEHSYDSGIFYYDVARSYGYGQAESIVGEFARDKRQNIIIASKFGILPPSYIPFRGLLTGSFRKIRKLLPKTNTSIKKISGKSFHKANFSPQLAIVSLEKSLKELKTNYIDIYLLHESSFEDIMLDDIRFLLEKEKDNGKIRAWGGTFSDRDDTLKAIRHSELFQIIQLPFGIDDTYLKVIENEFYIKVIYSVLNYFKYSDKNYIANNLNELKAKYLQLEFIENVAELMLLIAFSELKSGVILLSMTKPSHINRNLLICQSLVTYDTIFQDIKMKLKNDILIL